MLSFLYAEKMHDYFILKQIFKSYILNLPNTDGCSPGREKSFSGSVDGEEGDSSLPWHHVQSGEIVFASRPC